MGVCVCVCVRARAPVCVCEDTHSGMHVLVPDVIECVCLF